MRESGQVPMVLALLTSDPLQRAVGALRGPPHSPGEGRQGNAFSIITVAVTPVHKMCHSCPLDVLKGQEEMPGGQLGGLGQACVGSGPGGCTHTEEGGGGKVQERFLEAKWTGLSSGCK